MERSQQLRHILKVQSSGWLIEDIENPARRPPRLAAHAPRATGCPSARRPKMLRQLHALRLAAAQRRRTLSEAHIPQSNLIQHRKLIDDLRMTCKINQRFTHCHTENFVDVLALVLHLKNGRFVTRSVAFLARQFHVREKLHLDRNRSIAFAHIATSTRNVERERSSCEALSSSVRLRSKQLPNSIERLDICHRIRSWCTTDRRLVHQHHIVQILRSRELTIQIRRLSLSTFSLPKCLHQRSIQHLMHHRRLTRSRYARHTAQQPQRNLHIHTAQIVNPRSAKHELLAPWLKSMFRDRNARPPTQVPSGQRCGIIPNLLNRTLRQQMSTQLTRARPEVQQMIRRANHIRVMLNHQDRIAEIAQLFHDGDQLRRIARM